MLKRFIALLTAVVFLSVHSFAIALDGRDVERFMQTYEQLALKGLIDVDDDDDDEDEEPVDQIRERGELFDLDAIKKELSGHLSKHPEATAVIRANGYPTVARFIDDHAVISRAFVAHLLLEGLEEIERYHGARWSERERQELQATREEIHRIPAAELNAVRPYMTALSKLLSDDDDDDWDDD